jgi:lipoprotein-anchoring transpeptidase ErfK/SrfK
VNSRVFDVTMAFFGLLGAGCKEDTPAPGPRIVFEGLDAGTERAPANAETPADLALSAAEGEALVSAASQPGVGSDDPADKPVQAIRPDSKPGGSHEASASSGAVTAGAVEDLDAILSDGQPRIAATTIATTVFSKPHTIARRLGYIRLGGVVRRDPDPVPGSGCKGKWYRIQPHGYVCADEATIDMNAPLVRATRVRPNLSRPLPYAYGFVRATSPQYLRVPNKAEQVKSEFKLEEHLDWYKQNRAEIQRVTLGSNDVPLDGQGYARLGLEHPPGFRLSTQLSTTELIGGSSPTGTIPFWLEGGRKIPNVSGFDVPEYAVFADRVRRKTGLSFVDAFMTESEDVKRRFAVTVDLRLIPATKVKPDTGSPFHGVQIEGAVQMPFAFVSRRDTKIWKLIKARDEAVEVSSVPRRSLIPLSGNVRFKAGQRFYQTAREKTAWLRAFDIGVVAPPQVWPAVAEKGERWIDVSLVQQTLVLYQGKQAAYATLVSTGRDRLGDPKTSLATPQGTFRLESKHIAAAMDSEENSSVSGGTKSGRKVRLSAEAQATAARVLAAEKAGQKLGEEDSRRLLNVKKGRHPEYGVTLRRGFGDYELRDVPWIQYFAAGYALHGAYWHDVFGTPRSHGCINLAPIDARLVFNWTEPAVPEGWHGLNVSDTFGVGTTISIRE